ncbi:UNVERIFIED_CONTAM: AP2 domain transcription factor AP2VIIa-3 [Hammondia hammondi]|eukprot:XP_008886046.1 AP2 domain transcription factor AP2VIIa-3 [Hammondia hammondi]
MQQDSVVWRAGLIRPVHGQGVCEAENLTRTFDSKSSDRVSREHGTSQEELNHRFLSAGCLPSPMMKLNNGDLTPQEKSSAVHRSVCEDSELMTQPSMAYHQNSITREISLSSVDSAAFPFEGDAKPTEGRTLSILESSTVACSLPTLSRVCSINVPSPGTSPASAHTSSSAPQSLMCAHMHALSEIASPAHASPDSSDQPSEHSDSSTCQSASTSATPPEVFHPFAAKLLSHAADPDLSAGCTVSTPNLGPSLSSPQKHSRDSSDTTSTKVCSERTGSGAEGSLPSHYGSKLRDLPCGESVSDDRGIWGAGGPLHSAEGSNELQVDSADAFPPSVPRGQQQECDAAYRQPSSRSRSDKGDSASLVHSSPGIHSKDSAVAATHHLTDTAAAARLSGALVDGQDAGMGANSGPDAAAPDRIEHRIVETGNSLDQSTDARSTPVVVPRGVWYNRSTCCWLACVSGVGKRLYVFSAKRLGFERARQMAIDCKNGCLTPEGLAAASDDSGGGNKAVSSFASKCRRPPAMTGKATKVDRPTSGFAESGADWRSPTTPGWVQDTNDIGEAASPGLGLKAPSSGGSLAGDGARDDESTGIDTPAVLSRSRSAECTKEDMSVSEDGAASKEAGEVPSLVSERAPRKRIVSRRIAETRATARNVRAKSQVHHSRRQQDDFSASAARTANKAANRAGTPHGVWFNSHTKSWTCATVGPRRQLLVFSSARYGFEKARAMAIEARMQSVQALQGQAQPYETSQSRSTRTPSTKDDADAAGRSRGELSSTQSMGCSQRTRRVSEETVTEEMSEMGTPHRAARSGRAAALFGTRPTSSWDESPPQRQELGRCASMQTTEHKQLTEKEQQLLCAGKLAANLVLSDLLEVCLPQLEISPASVDGVRSSLEVALWTVSSAQHPAELQTFLRLFSCCFMALKIPSNMPTQTRVRLLEALSGAHLEFPQAPGDSGANVEESGEATVSEEELGGDRKRQRLEGSRPRTPSKSTVTPSEWMHG